MFRAVPLAVLMAAPWLPGQISFQQNCKRHFPLDDANAMRISLADLDNDGDLDCAATIFRNPTLQRFYRNDGHGVFAPYASWPDVANPALHLVADFDGDGDQDVILDGAVVLNQGGGILQTVAGTVTSWPLAFGDLDGDGQGDLVASPRHQLGISLWRRAGASFVPFPASSLPTTMLSPTGVAMRDFDGDGDRDLLITTAPQSSWPPWPGFVRLWRNDGSGNFTEQILPGALNFTSQNLTAGDFDGDGDQDAVLQEQQSILNVQWQLRLNDGSGNLAVVTGRLPANVPWVQFQALDFDRDGDLDLVAPGTWLENDGTARFTLHQFPVPEPAFGGLGWGDVDGDGDIDLALGGAFTNDGMNRLLLNDGTQRLVDATAFPWAPPSSVGNTLGCAGLGDVDRDGDVDALIASGPLCLNDGTGWFRQIAFPWLEDPHDVTFTDVDGDADLDALFISRLPNGNLRLRVCQNDGSGTFTDVSTGNTPPPLNTLYAPYIAVFDADGDGDADCVVGVDGPGVRLYQNDGTGRFSDVAGALPVLGYCHALAAADFDRDGDSDLLVAPGTTTSALLFLQNDGTGRFTDVTATRMQIPPAQVASLGVGDLDGDGDRDVFVACFGGSSFPAVSLWLRNDGNGSLAAAPAGRLPTTMPQGTVALGDLDADGDLDAVVGTSLGVRLWSNDGAGTFTDVGSFPHPFALNTRTPRLADLDLDGDLDLVLNDRIFSNQHWSLDAPLLARPGRTFSLQFKAVATAAGSGSAVPFFSGQSARIPLPPFGTLAVLPGTAFVLPPVALVNGAGQSTYGIPAHPSLAGLTMSIQAWITTPTGPHLSPAVFATIQR